MERAECGKHTYPVDYFKSDLFSLSSPYQEREDGAVRRPDQNAEAGDTDGS